MCIMLLVRVAPHGTKGTGPKFVTRLVYLRSSSSLTQHSYICYIDMFIDGLLYKLHRWYSLWLLQTSLGMRGLADSNSAHGM